MERTLDSHIPYLYVDASYFKVRDGVKYVSKALFVVVGVRTDGYREILGARVADAEHELTWEGIFSDLKERGLTKVDLIISDGHTGIQSAAGKMFPGSSWQMCHVHLIRAVLSKVPRKHNKKIAETLKECLSDSGRRFYSNIETLPNITRRSYSRSVGRSPGFLSIILPLLLPQALFITIPGCLSC
jgi:transposase-like protein